MNSTPKRHPDYALVKSALSVAQSILGDVNEETRRFENHQKMNELSRIIDMEGAQVRKEFFKGRYLIKFPSGRMFLIESLLWMVFCLKQKAVESFMGFCSMIYFFWPSL